MIEYIQSEIHATFIESPQALFLYDEPRSMPHIHVTQAQSGTADGIYDGYFRFNNWEAT